MLAGCSATSKIKKAENRLTSHGFMEGMTTIDQQLYDMRSENPSQGFIGLVHSYDEEKFEAMIEQRNYFVKGDGVEVFSPNFESLKFRIDDIKDIDDNLLDAARHPKQLLKIFIPFKVSKYDMIRKIKT